MSSNDSNKSTKDVKPTEIQSGNMSDKQAMSALKQNAGNIIAAIAVALAGYFGWTYWQNNPNSQANIEVADKYSRIQQLNEQVNLAEAVSSGEDDTSDADKVALTDKQAKLDAEVNALLTEDSDSIYAWKTLMLKARTQMDADDLSSAVATLKTASEITLGDAGLESISQLRYAQALFANKELDKAMKAVSAEMPGSFEASKQELMGDIFLAQGDKESAIRSYENAWKQLAERKQMRSILSLKMESLGIQVEPIEIESPVAEIKPQQPSVHPATNAPINAQGEVDLDAVIAEDMKAMISKETETEDSQNVEDKEKDSSKQEGNPTNKDDKGEQNVDKSTQEHNEVDKETVKKETSTD